MSCAKLDQEGIRSVDEGKGHVRARDRSDVRYLCVFTCMCVYVFGGVCVDGGVCVLVYVQTGD